MASRHRSATATSSSTDQCVDVLHLELLWVICFRMRDRAAYEEQPSTSHHPRRPCNPTACPLAGGVPPYQSACPLIEMPHRDAKSTSRDAASRCQVDESRCRIEIPSSTRPTNRRHSNRVPPEMLCLSNPTTVGNDSVAFVPSWPRRCHPLRGVLPRRAPAPSGVEVHL